MLEAPTGTLTPTANRDRLLTFLRSALESGASSLHFEPDKRGRMRIRARIGGALINLQGRRSPGVVRALVTSLKRLAGFEDGSVLPQSERAVFPWRGEDVSLRVSSLPTRRGEILVAEVVDVLGAPKTLAALGLGPSDLKRMRFVLDGPASMILVAGPARSGKRTFLSACLRSLAEGTRRVVSIAQGEPDMNLEGVLQIELRPDFYFTRPAALRRLRSLDADAVHVDRLDSSELIEQAVRTAANGYTLLSSVNAVDAVQAALNLVDSSERPYWITQNLSTVVATRLPRRLCLRCREPCPAPDSGSLRRLVPRLLEERLLVGWEQAYKPRGCPSCAGTGHQGRRGLFEVLRLETQRFDRALATGSRTEARDILQEQTRSLRENALLLASVGDISVVEALKTTPPAPHSLRPSPSEPMAA